MLIKKKSIKNNSFEQTQFNLVFIEFIVAYDHTKMGYLLRFLQFLPIFQYEA